MQARAGGFWHLAQGLREWATQTCQHRAPPQRPLQQVWGRTLPLRPLLPPRAAAWGILAAAAGEPPLRQTPGLGVGEPGSLGRMAGPQAPQLPFWARLEPLRLRPHQRPWRRPLTHWRLCPARRAKPPARRQLTGTAPPWQPISSSPLRLTRSAP